MIDTIIIALLSLVITALIITTIFYNVKYKRMIRVIAQLVLDKEVLADKLDKVVLENSKEVNEGFIKFLSESREAAFSYIESVQNSVQNYLAAHESGNNDKIVTARMELFSHLPEQREGGDKKEG